MTISSTASEISYSGDGASTAFAIPFPFDTSADLKVLRTSTTTGTIETLTTGFVVSGGGGSAGTCTFTTAPASGYTITILDDPALTQPADYTDNDAFPATTHERALDRTVREVKRLYQQIKRSIRTADGDPITDMTLGSVDNRKGKYLFFNAVTGAIEYAVGIATTALSQSIIGQLLNPQTAAEAAAGVTPVNYWYAAYNRSRYASWANWKSACDQAGAEGIVDGNWTLTANIELPLKSRFTGTLSGAFDVLFQQRISGWIYGLRCHTLVIRGLYFSTIENLVALYVEIDGYDNNWGVFWNEFREWNVDQTTTIDITNWAVNLNTWRGGRLNTLRITGNQATYGGTQAHANSFDGVDFTDGGVLQDDTAFEVNFMRGCYYEGGANIVGNFHIWGFQGDGQGVPAIARFAHIMGTVGRNSKMSRDFLSLSANNAAIGGCWDILDSAGKPPSLAHSGGTSVSVATDTSEPCGIGKRYEASFTAAFSGFSITLQPNGSDRFGLVLYYKSSASFAAIESNDGTGAIAHGATAVDADRALSNDWSMLRISGPANKTSTTSVTLYAYAGVGGAAKVMSIGGFFATGERACIAPSKPQTVVQYATVVYNPPSLADGAGVTTTLTVTGAARGGFVKVSADEDLQGVLLTAYWSVANTISVRFQNETGGVVDLPNLNLRVQIQTPYA